MQDEDNTMNGIAENGSYDRDTLPVHPLGFDWAIYAHLLKEADLTTDQQRLLIETLWTIANVFADIRFGLDPVQQACGEDADLAALIVEDVLYSEQHSETDHNNKSGESVARLPEGGPR